MQPLDEIADAWNEEGRLLAKADLHRDWPSLFTALTALNGYKSKGSLVADREPVAPVPPSGPNAAHDGPSRATAGHGDPAGSSAAATAAQWRQEPLLPKCPACESPDMTIRFPVGFMQPCKDPWHDTNKEN